LQGHYTQVVVASRALVKCQLYSSSSSTVIDTSCR